MNTVLLIALIGTVLLVLFSATILAMRTYQNSLVSNASTNSQRTIAQVSNTVNDYLKDVDEVMAILTGSLEDRNVDREEFFDVFLKIRPDVVAVSTYDSSGQLTNCYSHMEKRGSKYLRYAIFNATKYVCIWDPTFAAYLAKKRAEGKHYNVAISHAAKKLVRLIYAMEKSGQPYRHATF